MSTKIAIYKKGLARNQSGDDISSTLVYYLKMKQLDLPQPLLLVTIGAPGTGKSTFAKQLATSHQFAWVHANHLRQAMFPTPSFSKREELAVDDLAESILEEMLRTKGNILFDGNANPRVNRAKIAKQAEAAGYKVLLVWLQTDAETARQRAARRGTREQDDPYATPLSADIFEHLSRQFTRPTSTEAYVVVSGKHAFPTQARTVLAKVTTLYTTPAPKVPKPVGKKAEIRTTEEIKKPKSVPSVEAIHHQTPPQKRSRVDITRHIKFR